MRTFKMKFDLTFSILLEPLFVSLFFSAVEQVINNVKDLLISVLSPTLKVTNYNKKKYCISPTGFQIIQNLLWLNLRTFIDLKASP